MRRCNPLHLLAWNSLFQTSRKRRLRRGRPSSKPICLAAEVLELRAMLSSANVAATVSGTALTLTSDNNGEHSVDVYRLDATHVEVVSSAVGTTINGGAADVFGLSSVSGITVNVGGGYDSYRIYSASGDPALNVGSGGILFKGTSGTGDKIEVSNESSTAMTIIGNVTVQGNTVGSPLPESGSSLSVFNLYTASSGSLTVDGSVSTSQIGTGTGRQYNQIFTNGAGNLHILGSVTETSTETSSGYQQNYIYTDGTGNVTIGLGVAQSGTGGSGDSFNRIYVDSGTGGNFSIGGPVTQAASNSSIAENDVYTTEPGNLVINFSLTQTATSSNDDAENNVYDDGIGNVTIGAVSGGVTQTGTSLGTDANNSIYNESSGVFTVGLFITQNATATSRFADNNIYNGSSGSFTVGTLVTQTTTGGTNYGTNNNVYNESSGTFTVGLSITQNASSPSAYLDNSIYNESSGLFMVGLSIAQNAVSTSGYVDNSVYNESNGVFTVGLSVAENAKSISGYVHDSVYAEGTGNFTVGPGGITINESNSAASGNDGNLIYTESSGSLSTTGLVTINAASSAGSPYYTENEMYTHGSAGGTLSALGIVITDSGSEQQRNYVFSNGAAVNIGVLGITIIGSGSGYHRNEIITDASSSPITITGSITVIDTGTGHSYFELGTNHTDSPLVVGGNVTYDNSLNSTGRSNVDIYGTTDDTNGILTIKGSLFLNLAKTSGTASDNVSYDYNYVYIGEDEGTIGNGYGAVVNGLTIITGSNGEDEVYIKEAQLKLGAIINTMGNPSQGSSWHDEVEIDGSSFGSTALVAMSGPNAEIDINNGGGHQPTIFSGPFEAIMTGSNSVIVVADGSGSGYSPVTFSAGAIAIGGPNTGDKFEYNTANVTGAIVPTFFTLVPW